MLHINYYLLAKLLQMSWRQLMQQIDFHPQVGTARDACKHYRSIQYIDSVKLNDSDSREDVAAACFTAAWSAASIKQKMTYETFLANQKSLVALFGDSQIPARTA